MIIGANTYTKVQAQLKMASHPEDFPANSTHEPQMQSSVSNMEIPLSGLLTFYWVFIAFFFFSSLFLVFFFPWTMLKDLFLMSSNQLR